MTSNFEKCKSITRILHELEFLGLLVGSDYDSLYDLGVELWYELTPQEQETLRQFSADLEKNDERTASTSKNESTQR